LTVASPSRCSRLLLSIADSASGDTARRPRDAGRSAVTTILVVTHDAQYNLLEDRLGRLDDGKSLKRRKLRSRVYNVSLDG
jgi:hypothetical protein